MNEGVRILLERIKTHPEEFMKGGRWVRLIAEYMEYLPEELKPVIDESRKLVADEFTKDVIKELLHAENQEDDEWVDKIMSGKFGFANHRTTYGRLKYDDIEKGS